jgi:hypothetical protein
VCCLLNKPFDAAADEARPGHRLMDLFSWRIHFKESESKEDVDQAEFLERQFDLSDAVPSCVLVATDVSVSTEGKWQAASVAWFRHGGKFLFFFFFKIKNLLCRARSQSAGTNARLVYKIYTQTKPKVLCT